MGETVNKESGAAKPKESERPFTQITSVIYMGPWTLKERTAASAAIGIASGLIFFLIWLYVAMQGGGGPPPSLLWPIGATIVMTVIAFVSPGWAEHLFEKLVSYRE